MSGSLPVIHFPHLRSFARTSLRIPWVKNVQEANKATAYYEIVETFTSNFDKICKLPIEEVNTKSNLSSEVLKDVVSILGLDYGPYETKAKFIDEKLLKNRNTVAHGEYLEVDANELIDLHETILGLMNLFLNQISNAASTKAYERISSK